MSQEEQQQEQQQSSQSSWTPPASQADLDRIISDRLARERSKFSDYDDLKSKAGELDQIKAGQKSELEKAADKVAAAETAKTEAERLAAERETELLRFRVARDKKITGDDLVFLNASTKEDLEKQADLILAKNQGSRRDPGQGQNGQQVAGSRGLAEAQRRFGTKQ